MLHYLENMFWGIIVILLPFLSFNRWFGIQLNPQFMGIDLKYVTWFSFFSGHILLCQWIQIILYSNEFEFVMTSILHVQWFSIFPVTLMDWAFSHFLPTWHVFYILNQFIITFQLIPLSTSWVGWLNLSGILIITHQINILGMDFMT